MEINLEDLEFNLRLLSLHVNQVRADRGLSILGIDSYLMQAAQEHVMDMAKNNFVSHIGSNGSNYIQRVQRAGSDISPSGEIICKGPGGQNRFKAVIQGWLNSPGHRNILLDPYQLFMGIGCHLKTPEIPGNYWLVNFSYRACGKYLMSTEYALGEPLVLEDRDYADKEFKTA